MSSRSSQVSENRTCIVSACLLGLPTRYDGKSKPSDVPLNGFTVVPVCPEQLGGLPTPRPACRFIGGDGDDVLDGNAVILNGRGRNVTKHFISGAKMTLEIAVNCRAKVAFLKARSPSCGCSMVTIDGDLVPGKGVTAALLARHGISCIEVD